jgi:hypothetical protein
MCKVCFVCMFFKHTFLTFSKRCWLSGVILDPYYGYMPIQEICVPCVHFHFWCKHIQCAGDILSILPSQSHEPLLVKILMWVFCFACRPHKFLEYLRMEHLDYAPLAQMASHQLQNLLAIGNNLAESHLCSICGIRSEGIKLAK